MTEKDLENKIREESFGRYLIKTILKTPYTYYTIARLALAAALMDKDGTWLQNGAGIYFGGTACWEMLGLYVNILGAEGAEFTKRYYGNLPFEAAHIKYFFGRKSNEKLSK